MDAKQYYQEEEITVKDLILALKKYLLEIIKNWKWLLVFMLPIMGYMGYKAYSTPITYKATLTFMVNEDEGGLGAASAAAGILGSLGLSGGNDYNLDKILELAKSFRIISESILRKSTIDGKEDYYANHIIRIQNLQKEWMKDKDLNNFSGFSHSDITKFTLVELKALKSIYTKMVGSEENKGATLFATNQDKLSGIMSLTMTSRNEELSINLIKEIYDNLGTFYVLKSIEKQKFTYEVIISKADSLKRLLTGKEVSRARFDDQNRGLISEQSKVPAQRLSRDLSMLNIMYSESIKNAEVADFAIKSKVPFVQSIDIPIRPLKPIKVSLLKQLIIAAMGGFILGTVFIIGRRIILDSFNEEN